ncbi:MAG TPA: flagellar type III secretion system pore protein FliP [Longimicrobiaceae bacterium]|nr:flagellar type III secretion system pore protein FliP [Longimicrobiaceae bacterium]
MAAMGVVAALGLVLALLGLSLRYLQRFAPGGGARGRLPMQIVQRLALGPKQGIAVVRIGERVLAVSIGDGGVRPLLELDESEIEEMPAATVTPPLAFPQARQFRALLRAARRSAAVLLAALSFGVATPASAQVAETAEVAQVAPSDGFARADTMITRLAPQIDVRVGSEDGGLRLSGTVGIVVMMGLLTLLPTLILMMTSFTRILIVLHFLRQALGTQSSPPAHLMAGLALLLTGFVMAPTLSQVNEQALQPWMDGQIDQAQMLATGAVPFREFMLSQTRESDLVTFMNMSSTPSVESVSEVPMVVLISAFVTSELRTAFQIGFALFLPFIIIDLVVASVLMSMGMFMLPPAMIALPFKLLLFVLVDGWSLIVQGLVASFG